MSLVASNQFAGLVAWEMAAVLDELAQLHVHALDRIRVLEKNEVSEMKIDFGPDSWP
ncbi:MAG TPA: hypothetical protein VGZ01_11440 [Trinickia sp.]|nr:hypothetical protein [Trinickia sp.]